jgi:hypothetical protein
LVTIPRLKPGPPADSMILIFSLSKNSLERKGLKLAELEASVIPK